MKTNISQARINQQIRNLLKEPLPYLKAAPLENDLYTWHFTIQGPENSDFHEGLYHGQILLPFQYPFKPPDIVFMNKNARFQTNTKICLTITQYHPQEWNSAWTIRTMLEAVISLFNQNIQGIGYQEGSSEQRKSLAKKSHDFKCDKCGVLKDLLKPRDPQKEEQKKQQKKNEHLDSGMASGENLQYASQMTFRKVKTEDNRNLVSNKQFLRQIAKQKALNQKESLEKEIPKFKQSIKNQPKDFNSSKKQQKKQTKNPSPSYLVYYPQNNSFGLDKKIHRNYVLWAKVLKSQKWSTIE